MHTVVSTLPWKLREYKPGLVPSVYEVEEAPKNGFSIKHIGDGYHFVHLPLSDEKTPPMRIVDPASVIARGLIEDYVNSAIFISRETNNLDGIEAIPGMFAIDGKVSEIDVKVKHQDELDLALRRTRTWFKVLVQIADDDWAKTHQHKMISDIQKRAARYLGIEREWDRDIAKQVVVEVKMTSCWACKTEIPADAIICRGCNAVINMEEFKKKKDHFANMVVK